ncbi:MAG: ThiJ/PfpI family protein [Solirubrobacterales bacterium]|nr:ThiJ/PfpI family protein [Solirubrobacterales bacterium]
MEYVAVVAVVALVLVVTAAAVAAPGIVNGVGQGFRRALCKVTGEDCATVAPRPCVVRTAGTDVSATAKLTFVKFGRTTALLRSVSSDGTVTLTLLDHVDAGLTAGIGASGRLQLGGLDLSNGALAQVAAVARLGGGRTWTVRDTRAADRLQRELVEVIVGRAGSTLPLVGPALQLAQSVLDVGSGRDLPRPSSRTIKGDVSVSARVKGPLATELQAVAGIALGGTQNLKDGGGTIMVNLDAGASGDLASGLAGLGIGGVVGVHVTLDRHGEPAELELTASGQVNGFAAVSPGAPGVLTSGEGHELSAELMASLDLTVPAHLAAARRVLRALVPGHRSDLPAAARALGTVVAAGGRLDVTRYGRREQQYAAGAEAALGAGAGVQLQVTRAAGELLDAWTRPAGGSWERRVDCLDVV